MRIAVLPRDVADRVITNALVSGAWAVNIATLLVGVVLVTDYLAGKGRLDVLPVPLAVLVVLVALAILAALRSTPVRAGIFLAAATVGNVAYEVALLTAVPEITHDGVFVLSRVGVALVLVGTSGSSALAGSAWSAGGFLLAVSSMLGASLVTGVDFIPALGALTFMLLTVLCYATLWAVQAAQRRRVPDFVSLEREMQRMTEQERLRLRSNAAVHDTLLNDLTLVMNAPGVLDERTASRLLTDIQRLERGDAHVGDRGSKGEAGEAELRNGLQVIVNDLQWQGLTVNLSGGRSGTGTLATDSANALIDAARAALENVLRHSGRVEADLELSYSGHDVTIIVSDHGAGFDPDSVPADRLGLRDSIAGRIRLAGGVVKIWSSPGAGTSIMMRVPFEPGAAT